MVAGGGDFAYKAARVLKVQHLAIGNNTNLQSSFIEIPVRAKSLEANTQPYNNILHWVYPLSSGPAVQVK